MARKGGDAMPSLTQQEAEQRIIALAEELGSKNHLTGTMLTEKFGLHNLPVCVTAANSLAKARRLRVFEQDGEAMWQLDSQEQALKFRGLTQEHMIVLQEIQNRGAKGVFKKDLKRTTGLAQQLLTRILKVLESRKLIKAVKTITNKNMNLYVLINVTPSREHTGGPWYTEQEFDDDFVERISNFMHRTIENNQVEHPEKTTLKSMANSLQNAKVLTVELNVSDLKCVLNKLVYENKIVPQSGNEHRPYEEWHWKTAARIRSHNYLDQVPCGVCPVRKLCRPGGVHSPTNCEYMDQWLRSNCDQELF